MTRNYDEEEQGYDSDKPVKEEEEEDVDEEEDEEEEEEEEGKSDESEAASPPPKPHREFEGPMEAPPKKSKQNGDDHHQADMDMSDWENTHTLAHTHAPLQLSRRPLNFC